MIYLDPGEVHREYEAMMKRPASKPAWVDKIAFLIAGAALGFFVARMLT